MHRSLRILGTAVLIVALSGCNYFRPAQPELPADGGTLVPEIYTSIDRTLETIQLAIQNKSTTNGQSAYIGAFANPATDGQGFNVVFDPVTLLRFPNAPTEWSRDQEELFYASLSRQLASSTFLFSWGEFEGAPEDPPATPSTATIYRSYLLLASGDEGATYSTVAQGNVELRFILVGTNWKIVEWIDSEDPDADFDNAEYSFGHLRLSGS